MVDNIENPSEKRRVPDAELFLEKIEKNSRVGRSKDVYRRDCSMNCSYDGIVR